MNYKDITIEEVEKIYNVLGGGILCNADKQEIIYNNTVTENIEFIIKAFEEVKKVAKAVVNTVVQVFNTIKEYITKLLDKKITKKRFIKLLQSYGLQRNDINKLTKNNKEEYTTWRILISIPPYY